MTDEIRDLERDKYTRMWHFPQYRMSSPGEPLVEMALKELPIQQGDTIIDLGCGTGRAAKRFQAMGYDVLGFDIASNSVETEIPFVEGCLWDKIPSADWGFCTDVMEHIPPEMVSQVLTNIKMAVNGCFFQIATGKDGCGNLIGETLHLSVHTADWWAERLEAYWDVSRPGEDGYRGLFVCT